MLRLPEQWPGLPEILNGEDIAQFLKFSLVFILGLNLAGLVGALFLQEPGWKTVFWNSLALMAASGLAIWLLSQRRVLLAVYLAVFGNGLWLSIAAWMGAGVKGLTYTALILPVLTAALFLGQRAGFLAALASAGYGLFLLAAGRMGWLVNAERPISDIFAWVVHTAFFFIAAQLISIALWQVERALKKMHAQIEERAQTEAEIRRLNAELEQRIAERTAQLAESEERYRLISTVSFDYVFSSRLKEDGSLILDWVAGAFEKMTGYSLEEYIERGGWRAVLHPEDVEIDRRDMESLRNNQPVISELRIIAKTAEVRWMRVFAQPVMDVQTQQLIGIYGAVQDITARKQAEEALRASEQRFRMLVEQLPVITYLDDAVEYGKTVYISPQFEAITAYSLQEGLNSNLAFWLECIHPEDRQQAQEAYQRCFLHGEPMNREYRFRKSNGEYCWVQDRAVRLLSSTGQPEYILGVMIDISERKQAEQRLKHQAAQLSALYQFGQSMAASHSMDEIFLAVQRAVIQLMPVDVFDIAFFDEQHQVIDYVYRFEKETHCSGNFEPFFRQTLFAHVMQTGENLLIVDEAGWKALGITQELEKNTPSVMVVPLKPVRQAIGAISIQHNQPGTYTQEHHQVFITLANQVAVAMENLQLMQSLHLQAAALDAAANAIVISDADGIIQWVNPAFTAMTGYSSHEVIRQNTSLLRFGVQAQAVYKELWNTLLEGRAWQGELVNRRKDGSLYVEEQVITPVRDEQGNVLGYISIKQDITNRKQAEERELRRSAMMETVIHLGKSVTKMTDLRQCLREIHRSIQTGLGFDRVGLFRYDPVQKRVHGLLGTSLTGQIEDTTWFSEPIDAYDGWVKAVSETRGLHLVDNYSALYDLAGHEDMRNVEQYATLAAWVGEKPVLLVAVDNLLSGRKFSPEQLEALELFAGYAGLALENAQWNAQLEQRVAERTRQLEEANRELESLAYTIAHDLRVPARAIHGFASILKETAAGSLHPSLLQQIDRIRDNAKFMGLQVDDLLEFMRVGRAPLHIQQVDMNMLVESAREDLKNQMEGRNIQWRLHDLPPCRGDRFLLRRVWLSLLGNAIKFTRSRSLTQIEIGARKVENQIEYFIRDNGVGFDMRFSSNLFGAFQRLHHLEDYEGTGMGLAIVQRIIQRHGGRIRAEAKEGEGATFYFNLG